MTPTTLRWEQVVGRAMKFHFDTGFVTLKVTTLAAPYITGWYVEGGGTVAIDLPRITRAKVIRLADGSDVRRASVIVVRPRESPEALIGRSVEFTGAGGRVILRNITHADSIRAIGTYGGGPGLVTVDLRQVRAIGKPVIDVGGSVAHSIAGAMVASVVAFGVLLGVFAAGGGW